MKTIKMIVAYDGTNYAGWQIQPNALTIEEVLNRELSSLLNEDITVHGASRTDAGVHSLGNIAWFDTYARFDAERIAPALNTHLPADIRVLESCEVSNDYNPHNIKSKKTYEYRIDNRDVYLPTERLYSYSYHYDLDEKKMDEAIKCLVGEHDFTAFSSVKAQVKSRVRTIYEAGVRREGDSVIIRIAGDGFLYNMVRIIAGTLIEIGNGRKEVSDMIKILESKDRENAGPTAPPEGLVMLGYEEL